MLFHVDKGHMKALSLLFLVAALALLVWLF